MATVTDPVCGMRIDTSRAEAQAVYKGKAYDFCSEDCRGTFEEDPEAFVRADEA